MAKQNLRKWWKRLISPTSEDFKWLRSRAVALGTTAMAIIGLSQVGIEVPDILTHICNYVVILTVGVAGTASFTRKPLVEQYEGDEPPITENHGDSEAKPVSREGEEPETEI